MKFVIDDELVRLSKRAFGFSMWTLIMLYSEPSLLATIFFGIIALCTWVVLLIDFKKRVISPEERTDDEIKKENEENVEYCKPEKIIFNKSDI